jgi:hypothetical protein
VSCAGLHERGRWSRLEKLSAVAVLTIFMAMMDSQAPAILAAPSILLSTLGQYGRGVTAYMITLLTRAAPRAPLIGQDVQTLCE